MNETVRDSAPPVTASEAVESTVAPLADIRGALSDDDLEYVVGGLARLWLPSMAAPGSVAPADTIPPL